MKRESSDKDISGAEDQTSVSGDETFLSRWSRRKYETQQTPELPLDESENPIEPPIEPVRQLTDEDMPPIESLTEESDYSGFLSPKVSEALRKRALRVLFRSAGFNIRDGLDDYDEDYTEFTPLGNIITAEMRHRMEREMQALEDEANAEPDESTITAESPESMPASDHTEVSDDGIETEEKTS